MKRLRPRRRQDFSLTAALGLPFAFCLAFAQPAFGQGERRNAAATQPAETSFEWQRAQRQQEQREDVALPAVATLAPAAADDRPLFPLAAVSVEGETPLALEAIAAIYRDRLGEPVSQAGLVAIASAISELHRAAGFHLTRAIVPPQNIKSGAVRIKIIPGSIVELVVKGDEADRFGTRQALAAITSESPARLSTLERQLFLVNDLPGVRISDTTLEEIGTASGRFRLTVVLKSWYLFTTAGVDNGGSNAVGPWQAYFGAALNSLLVPGDSLALNLSSIPGTSRELRYGRIGYDVPIGGDGFRLGVAASRSLVWPGDLRRLDRTRSDAENLEFRATVVPLQTQVQSLWLTAGFTFSNVAEETAYGVNYRDRLRIASLTADYRLRDDRQGWTYASLGVRRGLGIDSASRRYDDLLSRFDGTGSFYLLHGSLTRYQGLAENWSLKLAASGQASSEALLISQQFYLGGAAFGRAFQAGWLAGDNGIAGSAELRYDLKLNRDFLKSVQFFGFIEGGAVRSYAEPKDVVQSLAAAGGGVRFFLNDAVEAGVTVAAPLTYNSPAKGARGASVMFSLTTALRWCPGRAGWQCG